MTHPASPRQAAFDALRSAQEAEGGDRTDYLLTTLTHAVLALSEPDTQPVSVPPQDAPRATQLLTMRRSNGGTWDSKRALATYKVLGIRAEGIRPLDAAAARQDLIALADAGLVRRLDRSSTSTADTA
ncbi:hypothetical protein [Streptomyces sp. NPDC014733]|uniref:hypothetical protein n=1 Tax=Streptomyces sp. NPDC014733 TaxID=3364885 RepID=UPI0036F7BFC5